MIEFFSTISGVSEAYPILPAKKVLPNWIKTARQEYSSTEDKRTPAIVRCPGILDIMTSGYVVTAPWDMEIHSSTDSMVAYINPEMETLLGKPPVQNQNGDGIAKHIPKRPWSNKDILKINTPWHIKSNYKFMMIPIPYTESFGFESCIGILDPAISSEINIQGYVNGYGVLEINAGTPLCQLIPITDQQYEYEVRDMNQSDKLWIDKRKYINNSTFVLDKSLIKRLYNRFIKGN
jgi:hypothetical protein